MDSALYDAGAACEANAEAVRTAGKHFFFQLADERHEIYKTLAYELADAKVLAKTVEHLSTSERLMREFSMIKNVSTTADGLVWPSVKNLVKVVSWSTENGQRIGETKTRYFVTSMNRDRLKAEQWLRLVSGHGRCSKIKNYLEPHRTQALDIRRKLNDSG